QAATAYEAAVLQQTTAVQTRATFEALSQAVHDARVAHEQRATTYETLRAAALSAGTTYTQAQQRYLDGQAGFLAQALTTGSPCPVCGSTEHPHKASVPSTVPSKEDIEKLHKAHEAATEQAQQAATATAEARTLLAGKEKELAELSAQAGTIDGIEKTIQLATEQVASSQAKHLAASQTCEDLKKANAQLEQAEATLAHAVQQVELARTAKHNADSAVQVAQTHVETLQKTLAFTSQADADKTLNAAQELFKQKQSVAQHCAKAMESLNQAMDEAQVVDGKIATTTATLTTLNEQKSAALLARETSHAQAEEIKQSLPYPTKQQALAELATMETKLEALTQARTKAEEDLRANQALIDQTSTQKKTLEEQLSKIKAIDVEAEQDKFTLIKERLESEQRKREVLLARISRNQSIMHTTETTLKRSTGIEEHYGAMETLAHTASGKLSGKDRISFETYVQGIYFDRIITAANQRLSLMTNGRFELKRREQANSRQGQSGLDLDVLDNYTGKARDASSLSGGESFEASLCLALGLSDVVQSHAGGIQLDTMFIDEGFGSLDQESLQAAIKMLTSLTGDDKLVGIISHVDELKSSLDRKIIVSRGRSGSTVRIEA
ncbi:MAG: SbcC/MukB-like Walker B domain-containing protein, partial [Raoultibacter sp.]